MSVRGGGVDVSEDAYSSSEDDDLGGEAARWWVRFRRPRVCRELWKDFPDSLPLFSNLRCNVLFVSLKGRSGECGSGAY